MCAHLSKTPITHQYLSYKIFSGHLVLQLGRILSIKESARKCTALVMIYSFAFWGFCTNYLKCHIRGYFDEEKQCVLQNWTARLQLLTFAAYCCLSSVPRGLGNARASLTDLWDARKVTYRRSLSCVCLVRVYSYEWFQCVFS